MAVIDDVVAFDSTFADNREVVDQGLQPASGHIYDPIFQAASHRYWLRLTEASLTRILKEDVGAWAQKGLENTSLFRGGLCYLETISHHHMIFVRLKETDLRVIGIDCDVFPAQAEKNQPKTSRLDS